MMSITRYWNTMIPNIRIPLLNNVRIEIRVLWTLNPISLSGDTFAPEFHGRRRGDHLPTVVSRVSKTNSIQHSARNPILAE